MKRLLPLWILVLCICSVGCGKEVKVLYWNIQNGMWHDQGNDYEGFVAYVREVDPDICVWAEAESRHVTGKGTKMAIPDDQYLPWNWDVLAERYGHKYTLMCGKRDTYPQVITSKYPLKIVKRIKGNGADIIVAHGAGWAKVDLGGGKELNIVTLHTWPQNYAYRAEDREASIAEHGGDYFRAMEMRYICEQTIGCVPDAENQLWLMTGDFNSISSIDNNHYGRDSSSTSFLVHDYIRDNTPYIDAVQVTHPGDFQKSTFSGIRVDYAYVSPALFKKVKSAEHLYDDYTEMTRDEEVPGFFHPSDHYPILLTFKR